jgi:hypothetical protein
MQVPTGFFLESSGGMQDFPGEREPGYLKTSFRTVFERAGNQDHKKALFLSHNIYQFPVCIYYSEVCIPVGLSEEAFIINVFDPSCPECCCNECGTEFTWDRITRPSCPSCSSKDVRSAESLF